MVIIRGIYMFMIVFLYTKNIGVAYKYELTIATLL